MNKLAKKISTLILSSAVLFSSAHINAGIFIEGKQYFTGAIAGMVTINNHSLNENTECFDVNNFRCKITIHDNTYELTFVNMATRETFQKILPMERNIQLTILKTILLQQAEHIKAVTPPEATKTRQKIKPLSKEDKHKEETKPRKEIIRKRAHKTIIDKGYCQCDTDHGHTSAVKTFSGGKVCSFYRCNNCYKPKRQDTVTRCNYKAYCKKCKDIKSFFMAKQTGKKYVLNCCGCWPFSNSVEEGSRLEFDDQDAFEKAINNKAVKCYCTKCKKEMEPSDVKFVPTEHDKKSVKCRICLNKASKDC